MIAEALPDGTVLHARAELGGTLACVRAAGRGATAVTADGHTALSVDDGETVLPLELPEAPTLLAVADAGPAATAALTGSGLHVVSTALDGTADAVLHRFPAAAAEPTALGWSRLARQTVLCLVSGTDVVLAADGDPRRELARLTHSARVVGLWSSVRAGTVAVADARGDLVVHRPASGTGPPTTLWGTGQAITALTGDPASGAVVWATEDGRVHAWRPDGAPEAGGDGVDGAGETATGRRDREEDDWDVLAVLPAPATSLAVSPESGLVVAADGGPRLLRLPWPEGGPATGAPVPFPVREVCPAPSGRLLLTGHGGEVEIRSEDGRAHLFTPAPVPAAPGGAAPPGSATASGWCCLRAIPGCPRGHAAGASAMSACPPPASRGRPARRRWWRRHGPRACAFSPASTRPTAPPRTGRCCGGRTTCWRRGSTACGCARPRAGPSPC